MPRSHHWYTERVLLYDTMDLGINVTNILKNIPRNSRCNLVLENVFVKGVPLKYAEREELFIQWQIYSKIYIAKIKTTKTNIYMK